MRDFVQDLRSQCNDFTRSGTRDLLVLADDGPKRCPLCGGPMIAYKTSQTRVSKTLQLGTVVLWEMVYACAADQPCRYPAGDLATLHPGVTGALIPKRQLGYDVMTFVGCKRFVEYQQRDDILVSLEAQGITIAAGTESDLAQMFTDYLRMLHDDADTIARLRQTLAQDGGYWIHIDATGENGRGTTVAVYSGQRHWILDVAKISTENADELYVILQRVTARFGIPLAIMSDMGKGVLGAIQRLRKELGPEGERIAQLICHLHFVRDLGKDLLKATHSALSKAAAECKIRDRLRTVERDLTDLVGDKEMAREQVTIRIRIPTSAHRHRSQEI